jgi:membrane fusion protein (multidrug efflux system)
MVRKASEGTTPVRSPKGSRLGLFLIFIIFSCIVLLGAGCTKKKEEAKAEKIINIKVITTQKMPVRPYVEAVGTLQPWDEVIISPEVDGIIKEIPVEEGFPVTKGMLLLKINDIDYRLGVQSAEAALGQAQAGLNNAKSMFDRLEALYKQSGVSKQEFDNASTRLDVSVQDVERAKAALSLAKERLSRVILRSPINGMVKQKVVTTGMFVKSGMPLLNLIQIDPLFLTFSVTEKDVGALKVGQDVTFFVDAFPNREFKGKVDIIYPNLDERSRMLKVEALIPNRSLELKPGFFSRVKVYTGSQKEVVIIPITSLLYEGTKTRVFLSENNKARERYLKLGKKYGEMMEIVEGLQAGEQLVVVGQNNLTDGVNVRVVK